MIIAGIVCLRGATELVRLIIYDNATVCSAITEIIARGEAEDNYYLIYNRSLKSGISVLYHAPLTICIIFNNVGFLKV